MNIVIEDLKTNGWSVVADVLTPQEVHEYTNVFWEDFEQVLGRKRNDPELTRTACWISTLHGIIEHYGIGHSRFMWKVRCNQKVQRIFRGLWGITEQERLITSFNGCCIIRPIEGSRRAHFNPKRTWLHTDQTPNTTNNHNMPSPFWSHGVKAIQGSVNLMDSDEDDACFYVLTGSHRYHARFFRAHANEFKKPTRDFFIMKPQHIAWFEQRGCQRLAITVRAGDMTLWDSRLVHCGKLADEHRSNPQRWRLTAFVCMMPRKLVQQKVLTRRQIIAANARTTCHWPNQPRVFPKKPRENRIGEIPYKEFKPYTDENTIQLI